MDLKPQTLPNTIIVGDLNTPLPPIGMSSKQKSAKKLQNKPHVR
jgi:hypothetical protein